MVVCPCGQGSVFLEVSTVVTDIVPFTSALSPQQCSVLLCSWRTQPLSSPVLTLVSALSTAPPRLHQDEAGYYAVYWRAFLLEQIKGPVLRIPGAWRVWPQISISYHPFLT